MLTLLHYLDRRLVIGVIAAGFLWQAGPATAKPEVDPYEQAIEAVLHHDMARLQALLNAGVDPSKEGPDFEYLLVDAVDAQDYAAIDLLLAHGADPNFETDGGQIAVDEAIRKDDARALGLMLRHGVRFDLQNTSHHVPLVAALDGHEALIPLLLAAGADPMAAAPGELCALGYALGLDHEGICNSRKSLDLLLRAPKIDLSHPIKRRQALEWALDEPGSGTAFALLRAGADPLRCGGEVLCKAADDGNLALVKALLAEGVPPTARDHEGKKPTVRAALGSHDAVVRLLLALDGPVRRTPLMQAVHADDLAAVKRLLGAHADPNVHNETGDTALLVATRKARPEMLELLLRAGARTDARDILGRNAVGLVVLEGPPDARRALATLLPHGVSPQQAKTPEAIAPLIDALGGEDPQLALLLLDAGADPNVVAPGDGKPALELACSNREQALLTALLAHGARVDQPNKHGETALAIAASQGNVDAAKALLDAGADPALEDHSGRTPLDRANESNFSKPVVTLLRARAHPRP